MVREYDTLAECMIWSDDNDFRIPSPETLLNGLRSDYKREVARCLNVLGKASVEERQNYYPQVYETLYIMAEENDKNSIHKVFELCPDLKPEGYYCYDQTLPLGIAIECRAYDAVAALLEHGCDIDCVTMAGDTTIFFSMDGNEGWEEMTLFLLEKGASLAFSDFLSIWVYDENAEFAKEMMCAAQDSVVVAKRLLDHAYEFRQDASAYGYGAFDDGQKTVFDEMVAFLMKGGM